MALSVILSIALIDYIGAIRSRKMPPQHRLVLAGDYWPMTCDAGHECAQVVRTQARARRNWYGRRRHRRWQVGSTNFWPQKEARLSLTKGPATRAGSFTLSGRPSCARKQIAVEPRVAAVRHRRTATWMKIELKDQSAILAARCKSKSVASPAMQRPRPREAEPGYRCRSGFPWPSRGRDPRYGWFARSVAAANDRDAALHHGDRRAGPRLAAWPDAPSALITNRRAVARAPAGAVVLFRQNLVSLNN